MRILIGTPVYDEQVTVPYFTSVLKTVAAFRHKRPGVTFDTHLPREISIARARNTLASLVLADERYSHLLFIDADMGFSPALIAKMIDVCEPVAGVAYPRRVRNAAGGLDYYPNSVLPERRGEFARAELAGTGIMLIQRGVFERMRAAYPDLEGSDGGFHPFAETIRSSEGGFVGEDVAFCRRWTNIGGEIWVNTAETIIHVGRERFIGSLQAEIDAEAKDADDR